MAAGAIVSGIMISIEVAKILIPLIQGWLNSGKDAEGITLTREQINALRALNDQLTQEVVKELGDAAKET